MVYGMSETVLSFLIYAKKKKLVYIYFLINRAFEVIVVESEILKTGNMMANKLSKEGITTTLINYSSVYAFMSRVNKIILG